MRSAPEGNPIRQIDRLLPRGSYSHVMGETNAYLSIRLDLKDPVEIGDFAALFAGMGGQFDDYIKDHHPGIAGTARMYVREVRKGSIVADLFAQASDLIGIMDAVLIITGFAAMFGVRIRTWVSGAHVEDAKRSTLKDANDTIRAVANDKDGRATITSYRLEEGIWRSRVEAEFTTAEARDALKSIEHQRKSLDQIDRADRERVLMTFRRSDIGDADVGARSGERVIIEAISERHLPLIYGSSMVEERIKDQMRNTDENVYRKGFVVDVKVETRGGRPAAYVITHVHQIIDLDEA